MQLFSLLGISTNTWCAYHNGKYKAKPTLPHFTIYTCLAWTLTIPIISGYEYMSNPETLQLLWVQSETLKLQSLCALPRISQLHLFFSNTLLGLSGPWPVISTRPVCSWLPPQSSHTSSPLLAGHGHQPSSMIGTKKEKKGHPLSFSLFPIYPNCNFLGFQNPQ